MNIPVPSTKPVTFVEETVFGLWFLDTGTWYIHVLTRALNDLQRLLPPGQTFQEILDVGCGRGKSTQLLDERFHPRRIVALDPDFNLLKSVPDNTAHCRCERTLLHASATEIPLPDASVDMVFCHQTFHHIADQETAAREFFRVLRPGGVLLFAESTRHYIHSWMIRYLFRHPMESQKSADGYLALLRDTGFVIPTEKVSYPYLWWSRGDLGILEKLGWAPPKEREETLLNLVATRP